MINFGCSLMSIMEYDTLVTLSGSASLPHRDALHSYARAF